MKLCLATAIQVGENYFYLFNLRNNIGKSLCLTLISFSITVLSDDENIPIDEKYIANLIICYLIICHGYFIYFTDSLFGFKVVLKRIYKKAYQEQSNFFETQ